MKVVSVLLFLAVGRSGLASAFARRSRGDRESHFTKLLEARDPYVQVAGAVYLAFEDEIAGTSALLSRSSLPGDPGAWAALVRASRGDKAALPRMLEVFDGARRHLLHDTLQARAQVLLSNSAAKSGLPQPFHGEYPFPEAVKSWWQLHGSKVVPYDPWLAILEEQRMD